MEPAKEHAVCGPMPNVMAALPNIGGTVCESSVIPFLVPRRKVWLRPAAAVPCSNAAKTLPIHLALRARPRVVSGHYFKLDNG